MSFQAYLDKVEEKTGKTPQELLDEAKAKGFDENAKAAEVLAWLKEKYELGRGHGMALFYVIKNGPKISSKHIGSDGVHSDVSGTLILTGKVEK
jgi:hypothetical protein